MTTVDMLLKRKAAMITTSGNTWMITSRMLPLPVGLESKPLELVITSCAANDEENWTKALKKQYGMQPLDMKAGIEEYPELYL